MEESKVSRNQVVLNPSRHIQNIDLAAQDVLGLLEVVVGRSCRTLGDLVEAGGEVGRRVGGLGSDAAEVVSICSEQVRAFTHTSESRRQLRSRRLAVGCTRGQRP